MFKTNNYSVDHSEDGAFDVEMEGINMDDTDIVQQEGQVEVEEEPIDAPAAQSQPRRSIADDSEDESVKKKNKSSLSSIRNIIISAIAVAGTTAVVTTAIKGANRKEQQFVASLNAAGSSKSAKRPPPYCDAVTCGGVYTDKVYLNDDLLCGGDVTVGTIHPSQNIIAPSLWRDPPLNLIATDIQYMKQLQATIQIQLGTAMRPLPQVPKSKT